METPTRTPLTHTDEQVLAHAIEAGVLAAATRAERGVPPREAAELLAVERAGAAAWERFAEANMRLVWLVVGPVVRRSGLEEDELFQEGFLGLLEAMLRFDHTRGARFATFALPWIRMRVANAAATSNGALGIPIGRARIWRRVRGVEARLVGELGRVPTDEEIARESGDTVETVRLWRGFTPAQGLPEEADLAEPEVVVPLVDAAALGRLVEGLDDEEAAVIRRRYGLGRHHAMSLAEVARELGLSPSTVRRREKAALENMRLYAGGLAA